MEVGVRRCCRRRVASVAVAGFKSESVWLCVCVRERERERKREREREKREREYLK